TYVPRDLPNSATQAKFRQDIINLKPKVVKKLELATACEGDWRSREGKRNVAEYDMSIFRGIYPVLMRNLVAGMRLSQFARTGNVPASFSVTHAHNEHRVFPPSSTPQASAPLTKIQPESSSLLAYISDDTRSRSLGPCLDSTSSHALSHPHQSTTSEKPLSAAVGLPRTPASKSRPRSTSLNSDMSDTVTAWLQSTPTPQRQTRKRPSSRSSDSDVLPSPSKKRKTVSSNNKEHSDGDVDPTFMAYYFQC
ncbi:hypothetical protein DL96DRAFT_1576365, partial [Flagelloscypha sp. PMI_526]